MAAPKFAVIFWAYSSSPTRTRPAAMRWARWPIMSPCSPCRRLEAYESCQVVASIANLLAPNCDDRLKPSAITASDVGFLRGVYKMMDPGASLQVQQNQIAGEMAKSITAKAAPPAAPQ